MPSNNPILNNPYEEPIAHYATNLDGELDCEFVSSADFAINGASAISSSHNSRMPAVLPFF